MGPFGAPVASSMKRYKAWIEVQLHSAEHERSFQLKDVFLVEDETLIRMMVADMVGELGHRVVAEAGNIEAAAQLARSARFDFAILDINIDGRNILPVAEIIENRNLPFLFCSGYGTTGLLDPFRQRPVLRKPFLAGELGRAIDGLFASLGG